jgi:hypothetical protein
MVCPAKPKDFQNLIRRQLAQRSRIRIDDTYEPIGLQDIDTRQIQTSYHSFKKGRRLSSLRRSRRRIETTNKQKKLVTRGMLTTVGFDACACVLVQVYGGQAPPTQPTKCF